MSKLRNSIHFEDINRYKSDEYAELQQSSAKDPEKIWSTSAFARQSHLKTTFIEQTGHLPVCRNELIWIKK
jgi:hypothetical protein